MSEQNIINPSNTSLLNPDYGYTEGLQELRTISMANSGKAFVRRQKGAGRVYDLLWKSRGSSVADQLRQWENQYRNDFFTLADYVRGRYFSGYFKAPLSFSPSGNEQWDIKGTFEELTSLNLYQYPANWSRDAIVFFNRNGFGEDLVKLTNGSHSWTWVPYPGAAISPGFYSYLGNDTAGKLELVYFGYGCRLLCEKNTDRGIAQVTVTRVRDGAVMASALVDMYAPAYALPAPVFGENLFEWSQAFDNAVWYKDAVTVTPNTTVAPDGTTTADTIAFAAAGVGIFNNIGQQPSGLVTVGVPYTWSLWLKAASNVSIRMTVRDTNFSVNTDVVVNVTTAWQRFSLTVIPQAGASSTMDAQIYITNQGATTVFAWGGQLERDVTAPLDYIRTDAAGINVSIPLDTYRVAVQATNTKNAGSSSYNIQGYELQVMQ